MDAHLLDTSFFSALVNDQSLHHATAKGWQQSVAGDAFYFAAPTLGELEYGVQLAAAAGAPLSQEVRDTIVRLKHYKLTAPVITHTAEHYGRLKSAIAALKMPKALKAAAAKKLPKPDTWIDEATGLILGIDENDLWLCAIALERNFNLVTFDKDMAVAKLACPDLRLTLLS